MSRGKKRDALHVKTTAKRMDTVPQSRMAETIDSTDRGTMIAEAAYFLAERRQFTPGYELDDWLAAEQQIGALLGHTSTPQPSG